MELMLTGIGGFISLLLVINGFYARKTLEKTINVELKLAVLIANHDATEERSKKNETDILMLRERYHDKINEIGGLSTLNKIEIEQMKLAISQINH